MFRGKAIDKEGTTNGRPGKTKKIGVQWKRDICREAGCWSVCLYDLAPRLIATVCLIFFSNSIFIDFSCDWLCLLSCVHAYELIMNSKPVGFVSHMSSLGDKCWETLEGFVPMHTSLEAGSGYACCLHACWGPLKTENGQKQVHAT